VTLTFDTLTLKVCGTSNVTWSKSYEIWVKSSNPGWIMDNFANFCTCYIIILWPWHLTAWPWTLQHVGSRLNSVQHLNEIEKSAAELSTIYHVFACNFRGGSQLTELFQGCVNPTSTQTWPGDKAIVIALHFCFRIRISWCIFKCGWLKVEWCFKRRQISHFLTPMKIRAGVGEISLPNVEALPTTEPPKYIWWPYTAWLLSTVDW